MFLFFRPKNARKHQKKSLKTLMLQFCDISEQGWCRWLPTAFSGHYLPPSDYPEKAAKRACRKLHTLHFSPESLYKKRRCPTHMEKAGSMELACSHPSSEETKTDYNRPNGRKIVKFQIKTRVFLLIDLQDNQKVVLLPLILNCGCLPIKAKGILFKIFIAAVAQLAEHGLPKPRVAGSSPVCLSIH